MIGSTNSSNSNRLVEVAREHGAASYLIDDHTGVREEWLEGVGTVGITSGASAPEVLVEGLVEWLRGRGAIEVEELGAVHEDVRFMLPKEVREYSGRPVTESNSIRATFSVPYDYEVLFTSDVLDPENTVLRDALSAAGGRAPASCRSSTPAWSSTTRACPRPSSPTPPRTPTASTSPPSRWCCRAGRR